MVSRYTLNDGTNRPRPFAVKYRDGRYHYLGRGSLGCGARIVVDQDTKARTAEVFDNLTHDPVFDTYPFAGQVVRSWTWVPGQAGAPDPSQIELTYSSTTLQAVPTNQGATYFTLPVISRVRREEAHFQALPKETVFDFVQATEGSPATVLGDSWRVVSDYDEYGDVLAEDQHTAGVDLVTKVKRVYGSDPATWLVGLLGSKEVCSTALGATQCRTTTLHHNPFGEVWSAAIGDPADLETTLSLVYARDAYGHVISTRADDAFGHHRSACVSYDAAQMFPYATGNAVGHIAYLAFDAGLGVQTGAVDANGLAARWRHDGFGRVTEEHRPDGTLHPKQIPPSYLLDPDPAKPFVYVCTIQRMALNLFGPGAVFSSEEGPGDEEADAARLPIPIHAFDLIIADECHRGYTSAELSTWRNTLDHFDAIKVGLTATPVDHTLAYFETVAFRYTYRRAIEEAYLVDFDEVHLKSEVRIHGVFLKEGDGVELVDMETGQRRLDALEDERVARCDTPRFSRFVDDVTARPPATMDDFLRLRPV